MAGRKEARAALLCGAKLHYNSDVQMPMKLLRWAIYGGAFLACLSSPGAAQQPAPPASGARILLLPRKVVSGDRATLAVLDVSGRLTPDVHVIFSNGDKVTTDATGRALFVAPLNPGVISAAIDGRAGKVYTTILTSAEASSAVEGVEAAPRVASVNDRMEMTGRGFCGDADANRVMIGGAQAL